MSVTTYSDSESVFGSNKDASDQTSVTDELAQAAHAVVDKAEAHLAHAERALRDAQATAGVKLGDVSAHAREIGSDSLSTVQDYIDQNPVRAVGIAFAAGYLLSAILKK